MKKHLELLSVLLGVGGFGMLFLSGVLDSSIVTTIGMIMVIMGIVGGLVNSAINENRDITSWSTKSDDGLEKLTTDKGQLPLGGYTSGQK